MVPGGAGTDKWLVVPGGAGTDEWLVVTGGTSAGKWPVVPGGAAQMRNKSATGVGVPRPFPHPPLPG